MDEQLSDSFALSPPSRPLRVALVGCGKIADGHVEEIRKLSNLATLVGVCDREPLMAEQLAVRYAVPTHYSEFEQMLDRERPDVVHVTTPPQSHAFLATAAFSAGCHVYLEKPFALDTEQTQQILTVAERTNKKVTVGYGSYFDPPALKLRRLIEAGELGDPVHVESFYGYDLKGPFGKALMADPKHWVHGLPGKLFHNIIDHMLNKIGEFVTDDEPDVTAFASIFREDRFGDARDQMADELRVVVRGERVTGYGTFSSHVRPTAQFVRVYGTRNTAHVDYVARSVTLQSTPRFPSAIGRLVPPFDQALSFLKEGVNNVRDFLHSDYQFFAGMRQLIALFYESILSGGPVPISYRDILRISRMLDAIFAQVRASMSR